MHLQVAIRLIKLKLHFLTKVSKNQKAWCPNLRYIMGLYLFGPKTFFKVKYLKNRISIANSSPVAGSTLHTAHFSKAHFFLKLFYGQMKPFFYKSEATFSKQFSLRHFFCFLFGAQECLETYVNCVWNVRNGLNWPHESPNFGGKKNF